LSGRTPITHRKQLGTTLVLVGLIVLLAGCATQPDQLRAEKLATIPPENGLLVMTYARPSAKERFTMESVYFRKVGGKKAGSIGISVLPFLPLTFDFEGPDSCGSLFVASLPAGDYEFYDFFVQQTVLGGAISSGPNAYFSTPFKVVAGKVCYLGELKAFRVAGPRALGMPGQDSIRFELSDQAKRDIPLLKRKYPDVTLPVQNVTPSVGYTSAYIRIE
jgi:hypothetical protein